MSKWEKLLLRIHDLSDDLRYEELKKYLSITVTQSTDQMAEAVITHFENKAARLSRSQNISE